MSVETTHPVAADLARAIAAHVGPWTAEDLDTLPSDGPHHEIVDGELVRKAVVSDYHNDLGLALILQLHPHVPPPWRVAYEGMTRMERSVREPDVVVRTTPSSRARRRAAVPASELVLALEIVNPGGERTDRVLKPREYAAAGIPAYWRLEVEPELRLLVHALRDGAYLLTHDAARGSLTLAEPFPLTLDLDALPR